MATVDNVYTIKLITGEEILARIDDTEADEIILDHPIKLREIMGVDMRGEPEPAYCMMAWLHSTEETKFTIDRFQVMVMAKIKKDLAGMYTHAVFHRTKSSAGSIKPQILNYFHLP
jgi:hypothetical protein